MVIKVIVEKHLKSESHLQEITVSHLMTIYLQTYKKSGNETIL